MKILLNTTMCIYTMNRRPAHVVESFRQYKPGDIGVTSVTVMELQFGVSKSCQIERNRGALIRFLAPLEILPFTSEAAESYGQRKARHRSLGMMTGELDCLIAAQAISLKLPLENWAELS